MLVSFKDKTTEEVNFIKKKFIEFVKDKITWYEFDCDNQKIINVGFVCTNKNRDHIICDRYAPVSEWIDQFRQIYREASSLSPNRIYLKNKVEYYQFHQLEEMINYCPEDIKQPFLDYYNSDQYKNDFEKKRKTLQKARQKSKKQRLVKFNITTQRKLAVKLVSIILEETNNQYLLNMFLDAFSPGYAKIRTGQEDATGKKLFEALDIFKLDKQKMINLFAADKDEDCRRFAVLLGEDMTTVGLLDKSENVRIAAEQKVKQNEM